MPAPSPLVVATNSVRRLMKESGSYRLELVQQQKRIENLEKTLAARKTKAIKEKEDDEDDEDNVSNDGNEEFMLKQQKTALEQTKATISHVDKQVKMASDRLRARVDAVASSGGSETELREARELLANVKV